MVTVQSLTSIINQVLPEPHAGLLGGILFGTKATLSKELSQALITTGTLHIVALSGMNITILTDLVNLTLLRVVSRREASLLTIGIIAGFVWFVGASPSVVRAAIMGTISLLAVIFGRQYWAFLSWVLAVGIMLLLNFNWLGDLSFQLSVLATLGIILFGNQPRGAEVGMSLLRTRQASLDKDSLSMKKGRGGLTQNITPSRTAPALVSSLFLLGLKENLRLTLAAQVFTVPLILLHFHRISLVSPLSNILIGWIIQPLTVMGLFTATLGFFFLPLGQIIGWVTWVPLTYLIAVVEWTSKIPFASVSQ